MLAEPQTEQAPATYATALLAGRIALLDSAWRLLPDVVRDDAATGSRLKAELQAILGAEALDRAGYALRLLKDRHRLRFRSSTT